MLYEVITNSETINSSTNEIRVKIYADEDFNPQTDIDLASLKFGASELVNIDKGCKALTIEADGTDAIITFEGDGNGLSSESFTAKLLGQTKNRITSYNVCYTKLLRVQLLFLCYVHNSSFAF